MKTSASSDTVRVDTSCESAIEDALSIATKYFSDPDHNDLPSPSIGEERELVGESTICNSRAKTSVVDLDQSSDVGNHVAHDVVYEDGQTQDQHFCPPAPPPVLSTNVSNDELQSILTEWYAAGYQAGFMHGRSEATEKISSGE